MIHHAVRFLNALTLALAGYGIALQLRAGTLDNIGYVNAESQRAAVNKRKCKIRSARFTIKIFFGRDIRFHRHFGDGIALNFAQFADTVGHFLNFEIKT